MASVDAGPRVVIAATDCVASRVTFHAIDTVLGVAGVVVEEPVPRRQLVESRMRRLGIVQTVGQLLFLATVAPILERRGRARVRQVLDRAGLDDSPLPERLVTRVGSINDAGSIQAIGSLQPDVVVVAGTRIIREEVLRTVGVPFVNLHAGITPRYRGVHGGYWALAEGRPDEAGATVHLVDPGIDTGAVLAQPRISPTRRDTFATYFALQLAAGVPALVGSLPDVVRGASAPLPSAGPSVLRYHPTVWAYAVNRLRGVR